MSVAGVINIPVFGLDDAATPWLGLVFWGYIIAGGLFVLVAGATPVEVIADPQGIRWRQLLKQKSMAWSEIESVGVGASEFGRVLGVNLRRRDRDAATVAYRRGFTGFDVGIRADFRPSLEAVAAELERRRIEMQSTRPASP